MEGLALRLIASDDDLKEWNLSWNIQADHLECKSCGWAQWPFDAMSLFTHGPDCKKFDPYGHLPWRDLAWIMDQIKRGQE